MNANLTGTFALVAWSLLILALFPVHWLLLVILGLWTAALTWSYVAKMRVMPGVASSAAPAPSSAGPTSPSSPPDQES